MLDNGAYVDSEGGPVVDVQAHFFPLQYLEALRSVARRSGRTGEIAAHALNEPLVTRDPVFTRDVAARVELMDAAGIDVQVISFAAPNVWSDDPDVRSALVRAFNDGCAELVREHPGRFALLASLPLPHVEEAVDEARRAFDELGAVGVSVCTHFDGQPIDDERFAPLYELLAERRKPVLLHPEGFSIPGALDDHGMEWAIGTPFDDTIAALRLIYGQVLERHPGIEWIVPHLGGTLPFLAQRLDFIWRLNPHVHSRLPSEPSTYLRRLWFDTVNPDPRSIALTAAVVGADRLLFGTDFPFASRRDLGVGLRRLEEAVDKRDRAAVRGTAAARLLGLDRILV